MRDEEQDLGFGIIWDCGGRDLGLVVTGRADGGGGLGAGSGGVVHEGHFSLLWDHLGQRGNIWTCGNWPWDAEWDCLKGSLTRNRPILVPWGLKWAL